LGFCFQKVAAQLDRPLKQGSGRNEGGVQEQWGDEIRTKEDTTGIQTAMTGGTPGASVPRPP